MRRRLGAHLAWPTKKSLVDEALGDIADQVHVHWMDWSNGEDYLLSAAWNFNLRPGPALTEAFRGPRLWIAPVPRDQVDSARAFFADPILGRAREWLTDAIGQTEIWRYGRHEKVWRIGPQGKIQWAEDDDIRRGARTTKYRAPVKRGHA